MLDEPTNDLDIETLELLEEVLLEFSGTVILVSHDRDFMDRVVTSLLVIDEQGHVEEQAGNFSDWEARGGALLSTVDESRLAAKAVKTSVPAAVLASEGKAQVKKKLNYKYLSLTIKSHRVFKVTTMFIFFITRPQGLSFFFLWLPYLSTHLLFALWSAIRKLDVKLVSLECYHH